MLRLHGALLLGFLLAPSAYAQGPGAPDGPVGPGGPGALPPPPPCGPHGELDADDKPPRPHWLDDLGLSSDQKAKIEEIHKKGRESAEALKGQLHDAHEELRKVLAAGEPAAKAKVVHAKVQSIRSQLGDLHFESMLAIREVLTPAQRAQFVEKMRVRGEMEPGGPRHRH